MLNVQHAFKLATAKNYKRYMSEFKTKKFKKSFEYLKITKLENINKKKIKHKIKVEIYFSFTYQLIFIHSFIHYLCFGNTGAHQLRMDEHGCCGFRWKLDFVDHKTAVNEVTKIYFFCGN